MSDKSSTERAVERADDYRWVTSGHVFCATCGQRGESIKGIPHHYRCPMRLAEIRELSGEG